MNRFIVDGFNLAFRAHFAFQSLTTSKGIPSGCIYGFLNTLKSLKTKYPNFEFYIAWDSFAQRKKEIYPEYKANRNHFNVDSVIRDLKTALTYINVYQAEAKFEEADDVIAYLAKDYVDQVYIYGSDKDMLQLVKDGKVIVIRPKVGATAERIYDEEVVKKEFGVLPADLACYQAFKGDSIDNVPGVPRLPSKVIAALTNEYHDPALIYQKIAGEKLTDFQRKSLQGAEQQVYINHQLVKLKDNVECTITHGTENVEALRVILSNYEIRSINPEKYVDLFDKNNTFNIRMDYKAVTTYSLFEEE